MKKLAILTASMLALVALIGCSGDSTGLTPKQGDTIHESLAIYDLSVEEPYKISIRLDTESGTLTSLQLGRSETEDKSVIGFKDGILTVDGSFFEGQAAGEKTMTAHFKDGSTERVDILLCTKVITTAQEFQDINNNLSGTYALGNDIDLSSIENFEPLGYFFGDETNANNRYFHGILEGNGHKVYNANLKFSQLTSSAVPWLSGTSYPSNYDAYVGTFGFESEAHRPGDNIGLFQIIGSSGVVRNVHFDNIKVTGRTIVGAVAGNCSGLIENCLVTNCVIRQATHFYDDDCNAGAVAGIVAGSGVIRNTVAYNNTVTTDNFYLDYGDDYIGQAGNGWDHPASGDGMDTPAWIQAGVNKVVDSVPYKDSNDSYTNGTYAFAGKTWGLIENSYAEEFNVLPQDGTLRTACFSQTHLAVNKPTSGDTNLGTLTNCDAMSEEELKAASLYSAYDLDVWNIADGQLPSLKQPVLKVSTYGEVAE